MKVDTTRILAVSAKQFAEMIGVSVRTIHRLKASGKLPPSKQIGGSVRWRVSVIEDWLASDSPDVQATLLQLRKGV